MKISKFWEKMFDFKGKSKRLEFWSGYLVNLAIYALISCFLCSLYVNLKRYESPPITFIIIVYSILIIIGSISSIIRRLRDAGIHPAALLLLLIPLGNIAIIVCLFLPTKAKEEAVTGEANEAGTIGC